MTRDLAAGPAMPADAVIGLSLVAAVCVLALVVLHYLNAKCPRCRRRSTHLTGITPGRWVCRRCNDTFGPGKLTDH